ncbi:hypothetical protein CANARDRAFT_9545 [[Candida] arabinofermentans NRRL YB-2248]|uniref:Anaphase-promoting complex subunit 4 WD40 domain-containing protein n=1 Tax=[Candida] arabinofermentans NRRL YB-2248 TaxID=983967 RepID=A0A1E4SVF3_9ASCO|nr:hypothetical protein CANARDRAFT_9545 [[Candida] arabinofermentans NRRL YB-2248]
MYITLKSGIVYCHDMHQLLFEHAVGSWDRRSPLDIVKLYNESRYGSLNSLDSIRSITKFPVNAHIASVNSLSLEKQTNRFLLSGGGESSIKLWDLHQTDSDEISAADDDGLQKQYKPVHVISPKTAHQFGITHLKWWPDNGMWLSSSYDFTLKVFDASTMTEAHSFNLGSRVINFDFGPNADHSLVACCIDGGIGGIRLLDLRTLADSHTLGAGGKLQGGYGHMLSCCWSPTNPNLVVSGGLDGYCNGWDIRRSDGCVFTLDNDLTTTNYRTNDKKLKFHDNIPKAHAGGINSILFNDLGTELITLGNDEKVKVWDLTSSNQPLNKSINFGPLIRNKYKQHITMCLSPINETEMSYLCLPSDNGELLIYRAIDGKLVARLNRNGSKLNKRSTTVIYGMESSIRYYSGCSDGSISIWGADDNATTQDEEDIEFDNGIDYDQIPISTSQPPPSNVLDMIDNEMKARQISLSAQRTT